MFATIAWSQTYPSFPGGETDRATLRTQERVEELYVSEAYERAYFIYRNELAPKGDKYAQYMIGYMHFAGTGVPEDPAKALAWYRFAAGIEDGSIINCDVRMTGNAIMGAINWIPKWFHGDRTLAKKGTA